MELIRQSLKRRDTDTDGERSIKKQRLSSPKSATTNGSYTFNGPFLYTPSVITPPATASLRIVIPRPVLTKDEQRNIKIRQAAALRWIPKLGKPFPKRREINEAYNLKLMRHYRRSTTKPEPNFVKPMINTSSRVMRLLRQFPITVSTLDEHILGAVNKTGIHARADHMTKLRLDPENLQINRRITKSESARRLAWRSFSSTERDRRDNGRQALMESGLALEDLVKEHKGIKNRLPEWRKRFTGKYAAERKLQKQ